MAGLLIATTGAVHTLWVTVAMFLGAVVFTALTIPADRRDDTPPEPYRRAVLDGLRFVRRSAALRGTAMTAMLLVLFAAPLTIVLTIELQRAGRPGELGLITAMFAVGGIVGAVGYGATAHRLRRRPVLLVSLVLTGAGLAGFALFGSTAGMVVLATAVGLAAAPVNPITAVIMQEHTPERLRGRVIGSVASLALLAAPIGTAFSGALVDGLGASATFALIGAGCVLAAGYAAIAPGLRTIEKRVGVGPGSPGRNNTVPTEERPCPVSNRQS